MKLSDPAVVCVVSCCVVLRVGWIAVTWNPNYKCWVWYVWMMVEDDGFCFGLVCLVVIVVVTIVIFFVAVDWVDLDDLLNIAIALDLGHVGAASQKQRQPLVQMRRLNLQDAAPPIDGTSASILDEETERVCFVDKAQLCAGVHRDAAVKDRPV